MNMNTDEKMSFFMDLINCNYELHYWKYDTEFRLLETNWHNDLFSGNFFDYIGFTDLIFRHLNDGLYTPLVLEAESNLFWLAGFQSKNQSPVHIYMIGPFLSGRDTHLLFHKKLAAYDLSPKLSYSVHKLFEGLPTIPSNIFLQYAVMLHFCLNNEKLTTNDVVFRNRHSDNPTEPVTFGNNSHAGIWVSEQQFCKMLSEGNPGYKEALRKSFSLSNGIKTDTGNALSYHKFNCIVLLTLCSRACISGGLSPETGYDLNDYYAEKIEHCKSITDTRILCDEMLEDYVKRVQEVRNNTSVSKPILSSCEYIQSHLYENISIKDLAGRAGYTEYYFSHKFKQETGCSVTDFILDKKIEQAKLMLSGTGESIQSISDQLSFVNRSYFYSCFKKVTGLSPSEYRNQRSGG